MTFFLLVVLAFAPATFARIGVDVGHWSNNNAAVSQGMFTCLKNSNCSLWPMVLVWKSNGNPDETAIQNIQNAKAVYGGVAMYMRPCFTCGDPV